MMFKNKDLLPCAEETAIKLESVLGSSASFWLSREAQYRAKLAQKESEADFQINKII
jgi:plasmid maintenance system antidote protein VapI